MASQLRTASVTSSWVSIAPVGSFPNGIPGRSVSIKNKTGADLFVRKASETTAGFQVTLSDGESVGLSIVANASEVEISATAGGPTAGVQFIVDTP